MSQEVETFFAAWGEADDATRAAAIAGVVAREVRYADPRTETPLTGPEALSAYVGMFSQMAPGAVARVVKAEERDGVIRATVAFVMPDGKTQHGQYFAEIADGRIARLVGFVGTGAPE